MKTIKCNKNNYNNTKRKHEQVRFIVIHYTANNGDTAEGNGNYFKNNVVRASAHFFIGQDGTIIKSVPLNKTAWSVGGKKYADCGKTGGGKYYGVACNSNSVSIELCDNLKKDPSEKQIKAVVKCIKYIRKYCKNANYIIRHFDVNGKHCPVRMTSKSKWNKFKARVYHDAGMDKQ